MEQLENEVSRIFERFATFGSSMNLSSNSNLSSAGSELDNAKFAKLFKDTKIIGKGVTTTDVDIIFSQIKEKAARRIDFDRFLNGVRLLGQKKYPKDTPEEAYRKLLNDIIKCGEPSLNGATSTEVGGVFDKLLDSSKYTGAHKHRFGEDGKGRGIEGRNDEVAGKTLSGMVARK